MPHNGNNIAYMGWWSAQELHSKVNSLGGWKYDSAVRIHQSDCHWWLSISLYVIYVDQQCRKFRSVIGRRHLSAHDSPTKDSTQNEHLEISWISSVEKQIVLQGVLHVGGVQVPLHLLGFLEASCNPATLATGCDKKTNTLVTHVTCRATHSQCLVFLAQSF